MMQGPGRADTLQSPLKVTKTVMMKYSGQNEGSAADLVITPHHENEGLISFHGRPGQVSVSQKLVPAIRLVTLHHSPVLHQRRVSRNEHWRFLALCLEYSRMKHSIPGFTILSESYLHSRAPDNINKVQTAQTLSRAA